MMQKLMRQILFVTLGLVMRWPLWALLWILRPFGLFQYLYLVYPGSQRDADAYAPRWLTKRQVFSGIPFVGGIIQKHPQVGRGLYLVVANTALDMTRDKELGKKIRGKLLRASQVTGAKAIALGGQLPGIFKRQKLSVEPPLVVGTLGTVYSIVKTIDYAMERHGLTTGGFEMHIVGVGTVGQHLMAFLEESGHQVKGIDVQVLRKGVVLPEEGKQQLSRAGIVVALTPRGRDFVPYLDHLAPDAVIIDDTHPRIPGKGKGRKVYHVAATLDGVRYFPRLPGYRSGWVPGCTIEAMIAGSGQEVENLSQQEFNEKADGAGFVYALSE